jgi:hypothetical protein
MKLGLGHQPVMPTRAVPDQERCHRRAVAGRDGRRGEVPLPHGATTQGRMVGRDPRVD